MNADIDFANNSMDGDAGRFVELRRTFFELPRSYAQDAESDELEISEAFRFRSTDDIDWDLLLKCHRVIVLSEAGTGKTEEIRQAARRLRSKGKPAFFIRLEHVSDGLAGAFEEGDYEEFQGWLESLEEGWLFLDSVDEARLKHPQDFERAIRKLAYILRPALQRIHVTITGRSDAWRAVTDLSLCNQQIPYDSSYTAKAKSAVEGHQIDDGLTLDDASEEPRERSKIRGGFRVYSISDLTAEQVEIFARGRGVPNVPDLLLQLERKEAWAFTTRPQDLLDVIEFWSSNARIGSRSELIASSIQRRLEERRENSAAANPISVEKTRLGAKRIAAASTLMKEATIRIPDGSENKSGIDARTVLAEWNHDECKTILSRPIFDDAIYGAVRFHHRRVREYLTAEWINDALKNGASRRLINALFFKRQYGVRVLIPSMRPVLAWLVLLDDKIRNKASSIEPEVMFEGGDPSCLPVMTRKAILRDVCGKIAGDTSRHAVAEYSAIQRFANPDLADEIRSLILSNKANPEITSFLLRMIWQGDIAEALPEAKSFALESNTELYARIAAIRAVKEVGSESDFQDVINALAAQTPPIDRQLLAETIAHLKPSGDAVEWISNALEKTRDKHQYRTDGLSYALAKFVDRLPDDLALAYIRNVEQLLDQEPVIERRNCEVSERFGWLMGSGAKAVEKLVSSRHPDSLAPECLSLIARIPPFKSYRDIDYRTLDIAEQAKNWADLRFAIFWKDVSVTRARHHSKNEVPLDRVSQVYTLREYWNFTERDFERVKMEIGDRPLVDDKLVALSLAFQLYKENGRPRKWRESLKKTVNGHDELKGRLASLLRPPAQTIEERSWKRQEYQWKKESKEREDKRIKNRAESRDWLAANFETLRDRDLLAETYKNSHILTAQHYLLDRMREAGDDSTHWTKGNWRDLTDEFGDDVATAFRDGLLLTWRLYTPILRSEKDSDSTPVAVILGLSGLEIEASETDDWPSSLTDIEVKLACRYATYELNGFPNWLPRLHQRFPSAVMKIVLREIDWELACAQNGQETHYIIDKVLWSGNYLWDAISPDLLDRLESTPQSPKTLEALLSVVQSSESVSDGELSRLAEVKCRSDKELSNVAKWFAAWIGVDPARAIKTLSRRLKRLKNEADKTRLAMGVAVGLLGDGRTGSYTRGSFRKPEHLKRLYHLMHRYIKVADDIDRVGTGAYSPEIRDHAQDARNGLFRILQEIPGKETYLALTKLAKSHPAKSHRAWMRRYARERAESDAENAAMTVDEFAEFSRLLEIGEASFSRFLHLKPNMFGIGINLNEVWLSASKKCDEMWISVRNKLGL